MMKTKKTLTDGLLSGVAVGGYEGLQYLNKIFFHKSRHIYCIVRVYLALLREYPPVRGRLKHLPALVREIPDEVDHDEKLG